MSCHFSSASTKKREKKQDEEEKKEEEEHNGPNWGSMMSFLSWLATTNTTTAMIEQVKERCLKKRKEMLILF